MNVRLEVILEPTNGIGDNIHLEFPSTIPADIFSMNAVFGREELVEKFKVVVERCRARLEKRHDKTYADEACGEMETAFDEEMKKCMQDQEYAVTGNEEYRESCELCSWIR